MIEEAYAFEKIMKRKQEISLKKLETLVMLNLLLIDYHSGEKPKTTVIEDVKPESFEWVIKEAIRLIKEKENDKAKW